MDTTAPRPQVSVYIASSLDGFIATKDNGLAWLDIVKSPDNEDYGYGEFISSVDAVVLGRNSYDVVREFSTWPYEAKRVVVMTNRPFTPLYGETRASGALTPILSSLYQNGVRRVYLDGGKTLQAGIQEGVVDDLTVSVIPILLGDGISLFGTLGKEVHLLHRETKSFATGLVQIKYEIVR